MNGSSFEISPRLVRPLAIILLIVSLLVGVVTWNTENGVTLFKNGALYMGTGITNWTMNFTEKILRAANLPVPTRIR